MKKLFITLGIIVIVFGLYHFRSAFAYPVISPPITTIENSSPSFSAPLLNSLDLQAGVGVPTFVRADTADYSATVTDFEGLIKPVKKNEARFEGARRVENMINGLSENFSTSVWTKGGTATVTGTQVINLPAELDFVNNAKSVVSTANKTYRISATMSGSGTVSLRVSNNVDQAQLQRVTLSSTPTRFSAIFTTNGTAGTVVTPLIYRNTGDTATQVTCTGIQLEDVTGQANQNPSEYVSTGVLSAPYHGAGVDGVQYFKTYNGNTVASNVVTEATGGAIPDATLHGYVAEGMRVNSLFDSNNFLSSWVSIGTPGTTQNAIGMDGATSGWTLTDSTAVDRAGIFQLFSTTTGSVYTGSVFVKKTTGVQTSFPTILYLNSTGTHGAGCVIDTTNGLANLGTIYAGKTIVASSCSILSANTNYWRVALTFTAQSTNVGNAYFDILPARRLAFDTTLDYDVSATGSMIIWGAQLEAGAFATSYIPTTSATVERAADFLYYPSSGNLSVLNPYSFYLESQAEGVDVSLGGWQIALGSNMTYAPMLRLNAGNGGRPPVFYSDRGTTGYSQIGTASQIITASKYAGRKNSSDVKIFRDGVAGYAGTLGTQTSEINSISIGIAYSSEHALFGTVKNVKIWKKALTDTQLTNLTSPNTQTSMGAIKKTIIRKTGTTIIKKSL